MQVAGTFQAQERTDLECDSDPRNSVILQLLLIRQESPLQLGHRAGNETRSTSETHGQPLLLLLSSEAHLAWSVAAAQRTVVGCRGLQLESSHY